MNTLDEITRKRLAHLLDLPVMREMQETLRRLKREAEEAKSKAESEAAA